MYKTMDLFAGAGGLSYGFEMTNKFQIVAAAEKNKSAKETYKNNHKKKDKIEMIEDVVGYNFEKLNKEIGGIDIIIGGPPCQGFSNANRQKNHIISMNNSLVKEYFRAVTEVKPKAFVMENVSMLASETHRFYDSEIDHEMIMKLGIELQEEELVIAKKMYNKLSVLDILERDSYVEYEISSELFQLLNVLYKNRNSEDKLKNYITKNGRKIVREITIHREMGKNNFPILNIVESHVFENSITSVFDELSDFLNFQKAFILKRELDDNQILYKFEEKTRTGNVVAKVHSYPVIQYVKKIVAEDYEQCGDIVNSLWYGKKYKHNYTTHRKYDNGMFLLEHLNTPTVKPIIENGENENGTKNSTQKTHLEKLAAISENMKNLYYSICGFIESLGDDIVSNQLKLYLAYKKVQNMVCIEIYNKQIILFLKLNPETVELENGFTRDMRSIGHYGTGDLQITIKNAEDFEKAKPLLERAYNEI